MSRSLRRRGRAPHAGRDLLAIALILLLVDAIAALLLVEVYFRAAALRRWRGRRRNSRCSPGTGKMR